MRGIYFFSFLFAFQMAQSSTDLGRRIQFFSASKGPKFQLQFSEKSATLLSSLRSGDLSRESAMNRLFWRFYDTKSEKFLNDWQAGIESEEPIYFPISMDFTWKIESRLPSLVGLKLVLSVEENPHPQFFVDIGSYCFSHPQKFTNLSTNETGCSIPKTTGKDFDKE